MASKIGCSPHTLREWVNKAEVDNGIRRRGPWRSFEAVEFATLEWVDWFIYAGNEDLLSEGRMESDSEHL